MPQGYPQGFVDNEPLSFVADKDVKRPTHGYSRSNSQPAANDPQQGLTQDVLNVLHQMRSARDRLDDTERTLIDLARHHGVTWPRIARALGVGTAQAAQQRRRRLGGSRGAEYPGRGPKP